MKIVKFFNWIKEDPISGVFVVTGSLLAVAGLIVGSDPLAGFGLLVAVLGLAFRKFDFA